MIARIRGDYAAALRYHQQSLAIRREIGEQAGIVGSLTNLGWVAGEAGDHGAAERYFHKALQQARKLDAPPATLEILAGLADLQSRAGRHEAAGELVGLVLGHPAAVSETRENAERALARLRQAMPAGELEAALERGARMALEAVVAGIVGAKGP